MSWLQCGVHLWRATRVSTYIMNFIDCSFLQMQLQRQRDLLHSFAWAPSSGTRALIRISQLSRPESPLERKRDENVRHSRKRDGNEMKTHSVPGRSMAVCMVGMKSGPSSGHTSNRQQ